MTDGAVHSTSRLVYTRRDAQKLKQKMLLAEIVKQGSLTSLPTQCGGGGSGLGLQKKPATCFCVLHYVLADEELPWLTRTSCFYYTFRL